MNVLRQNARMVVHRILGDGESCLGSNGGISSIWFRRMALASISAVGPSWSNTYFSYAMAADG